MKALLLGSLLLSTAGFAQTIDVNALKQFMTSKQSAIESIKPGMSKRLATKGQISLPSGTCAYTQTSDQTVVKIEGSKIIILDETEFTPEATEACKAAGFEAFEESSLFYEDKPSLTNDLADLDSVASSITSISRNGDIVVMNLTVEKENLTLKYDFSKSSFRNLVSEKGADFETLGTDTADVNVSGLNLSNVLFCEVTNGERVNCVQGDFSDILF